MRVSIALVAAVLAAPVAEAAKRSNLGPGTIQLRVVGYRTDGIDTSQTGIGELKVVKVADVRTVSHPSSRYYAIETRGHTFLASEIQVALGGKIAKFTGTDVDPPEGSAASLMSAARKQLSPQKIAARSRHHK